jgi:hypothetical protein
MAMNSGRLIEILPSPNGCKATAYPSLVRGARALS